MARQKDDFQENAGKALLEPCLSETFFENLAILKKVSTTTSSADDINYLLNYLYDEAKAEPAQSFGQPIERQYRAGVALWELANALPENDAGDIRYKQISIDFALNLFEDAMCNDRNPYLRDYAEKIIRLNDQPRRS